MEGTAAISSLSRRLATSCIALRDRSGGSRRGRRRFTRGHDPHSARQTGGSWEPSCPPADRDNSRRPGCRARPCHVRPGCGQAAWPPGSGRARPAWRRGRGSRSRRRHPGASVSARTIGTILGSAAYCGVVVELLAEIAGTPLRRPAQRGRCCAWSGRARRNRRRLPSARTARLRGWNRRAYIVAGRGRQARRPAGAGRGVSSIAMGGDVPPGSGLSGLGRGGTGRGAAFGACQKVLYLFLFAHGDAPQAQHRSLPHHPSAAPKAAATGLHRLECLAGGQPGRAAGALCLLGPRGTGYGPQWLLREGTSHRSGLN